MKTKDKVKEFLDSIDSHDEYGFQIRPYFYWLPETIEDEIKRLEMNLAIYEQYLLNGSRFPESINATRRRDFERLRVLREHAP